MNSYICVKCQKIKFENKFSHPISSGSKDGKRYRLKKCKDCYSKQDKERAIKYRLRRIELTKVYIDKTRHNINHHIKRLMSRWKGRNRGNFNLTPEYLLNMYNKQKGLCFYTNLPMIVGGKKGIDNQMNLLSLDRINPKKGYEKGNVVFCLLRVNTMKNNLTKNKFIKLSKLILNNLESKNE